SPCHNSMDPACGPFRWQPSPARNAPMTATVTVRPAHPAVGQNVTFTVPASDPDGMQGGISSADFGDGVVVHENRALHRCDRYGAWTPPSRSGKTWRETLSAVYKTAGTYRASIAVFSATPGVAGCSDPYASSA